MTAELSSPQITSLLESVPGIASVLRSPVADALLRTIRAAAGLADFSSEDATELIRYAVRRGLIGADEGDRVMADLRAAGKPRKAGVGAEAKGKRGPARPKVGKGRPAGKGKGKVRARRH